MSGEVKATTDEDRKVTLKVPEGVPTKAVVICGGAWLTPTCARIPNGRGDYELFEGELTLFGPWARASEFEHSNLTLFDPGTGRRWLRVGGDRPWVSL